LFNQAGGTLLNKDYRFTKGLFTTDAEGNYITAQQGQNGAEYGAQFNWIDFRKSVSRVPLVPLPKFQREVLFADPESNQWNTGVMPEGMVERIKKALQSRKAPVHVIYNHYGYWHATMIVGFNDAQDNQNCKFVREFLSYMPAQALERRKQAEASQNPEEKERLLKSAAKFERMGKQAEAAFVKNGGCQKKGAFYVRDSIYGDTQGPIYDYDFSRKGEESPYVKSTVLLEYDWIRTMANHVTQIYIE
jgi:hypothetical protein